MEECALWPAADRKAQTAKRRPHTATAAFHSRRPGRPFSTPLDRPPRARRFRPPPRTLPRPSAPAAAPAAALFQLFYLLEGILLLYLGWYWYCMDTVVLRNTSTGTVLKRNRSAPRRLLARQAYMSAATTASLPIKSPLPLHRHAHEHRRRRVSSTDLISCVLNESHSHEDVRLLPLLLAAARQETRNEYGGSFVEMGAFDGETGSQTWMLEKCYGWRGLLIEGSPINYAKLLLADRANSTTRVFSSVCNNTNGSVQHFRVSGDQRAGLSAMGASLGPKALRGGARYVPCRPLPQLLEKASLSHVIFLSLDVEGAEYMVMKTCEQLATPSTFPFSIIMFEDNSPLFRTNKTKLSQAHEKTTRLMHELLTRSGLVELPSPGWQMGSYNRLYARQDLVDSRPTGERLSHATQLSRRLLQPGVLPYNLSTFIATTLKADRKRPCGPQEAAAGLLAAALPDVLVSMEMSGELKLLEDQSRARLQLKVNR